MFPVTHGLNLSHTYVHSQESRRQRKAKPTMVKNTNSLFDHLKGWVKSKQLQSSFQANFAFPSGGLPRLLVQKALPPAGVVYLRHTTSPWDAVQGEDFQDCQVF